jgi:hypothetical protein
MSDSQPILPEPSSGLPFNSFLLRNATPRRHLPDNYPDLEPILGVGCSALQEEAMRTHLHLTIILIALALCAGFAISARGNMSFELELVRAEMQEAGPQFEAAFAQYPEASTRVYMLYGHTPELREVFQRFGHNQIVSIIGKCFEKGDALIELSAQIDGLLISLTHGKTKVVSVSPAECGWRAILITQAAGNSFLGQYVVDATGSARLLPGSSVLAILKRLTTGGLQLVERRLVLGETPTSREWGLAALDVAVVGLAGKSIATAVKPGIARAARPAIGQRLGSVQKGMAAFARTYAPTVAKYGSMAGIAYLALHHPGVISSAAKIMADTLGVAPILLQTIVWAAILFLPLWIVFSTTVLLRSVLRSVASSIKTLFYLPRRPSLNKATG